MAAGEEKIWQTLQDLAPDEVVARTDAAFAADSGLYTLKSFGKDFSLSPKEKRIFSDSPGSDIFLQRLGYFYRLSATGYLALARDVLPTGRLVNPVNMKSGQLFFRGSHVLPLDRVAEKYGNDRNGFLQKGQTLGGETLGFGDASFRAYPLPRVPVVLILWCADEEFPPRADILFDSCCEVQLPIDVIWSIAMLSVLALL
jgi:hypothetical protein